MCEDIQYFSLTQRESIRAIRHKDYRSVVTDVILDLQDILHYTIDHVRKLVFTKICILKMCEKSKILKTG